MHIFSSSLKLPLPNLYKSVTAFLENFISDIEDFILDTLIPGNLEVNLQTKFENHKTRNITLTHQEWNAS